MIYTPQHFSIQDRVKEIEFVKENSFGTLISCKDSSISNLSKIPLLLKQNDDNLILEGHFARPNPHWKSLIDNSKVTILFDGPHGYVSPLLYEDSKKSVPTWNFSTVIIEGIAEVKDSQDWVLNSAMELSKKFESNEKWNDIADKEYLQNLSKGIVGVSIKVTNIQSKFKLSQNRSEVDKENLIKTFSNSNSELSELMRNQS